jgi:multidrug efflux pump subunit AcrB
MEQVREVLQQQKPNMPNDVDYTIPYDTTRYVKEAIQEISFTLLLTFILGVAPLVWAVGAGAASRSHIGVVVFSGMIAASTVALFIIPVLYYLLQSLRDKSSAWKQRRRDHLASQSLK